MPEKRFLECYAAVAYGQDTSPHIVARPLKVTESNTIHLIVPKNYRSGGAVASDAQ